VLGLVGFMYPSSGLHPWQELGRQTSRTDGSYPRQRKYKVKKIFGQKLKFRGCVNTQKKIIVKHFHIIDRNVFST
jgi:hypothetical protein